MKSYSSAFCHRPNEILVLYDGQCMMCSSFIKCLDSLYSASSYTIFATEQFETACVVFGIESQRQVQAIKELSSKSLITFSKYGILGKSSAILLLMRCSGNGVIKYLSVIAPRLFGSRLLDRIYTFVSKQRLVLSRFFPASCRMDLGNIQFIHDLQSIK